MSRDPEENGQSDAAERSEDLERLLEERARLEEIIKSQYTRTITVMFTDFKGSTTIAETEGDMASRLLIKKHHDILFPILRENGGVLVKTMGDGTLSWFEKAQDGVRAAVQFQASLKEFNVERPGKIPVIVRIGLNTGTGIVEKNDVFGDAVNVASRYESIAGPREIYISESTYDALDNRDEFRCRYIKSTELKGKSGVHKVFKVYWDPSEAEEAPRPDPAAAPSRVAAPAARPGVPPFARSAPHFLARQSVEPKKRLDTGRISEEREALGRAVREVRSLVIRQGDTHRLFGEGYKVYDDIVVEEGALLVVENAQLFFAGNAGIVSSGTFRAKNSLFSAMDSAEGWSNVSLLPKDDRISLVEGCTFRFGKGRGPGSLPGGSAPGRFPLISSCFYGGGILVQGAPEKAVTVKNCTFLRCSAHEGGGIFLYATQAAVSGCVFESCTAGISGGGIGCLESASPVKNCTFTGCTADKGGGGMSCRMANPAIDGCTFDRCSTRYLFGGGVHCEGSSPVLSGSRFLRCSASKNGGGIYSDDAGAPRLQQTTFTDCIPNDANVALDSFPPKKGRFL